MGAAIVTTLTPDELADLLAPRLARRLEAEWQAMAGRRTQESAAGHQDERMPPHARRRGADGPPAADRQVGNAGQQ